MNKVEFIARIRHLAWCAYQMGVGQAFNPKINNDQLESLKDGIKFQLENPNCTPEENHNNWMKMKKKQGWIYGETKNFIKKTHPDLVPYDELPEVERIKDEMDMMAHREALKLYEEVNKND